MKQIVRLTESDLHRLIKESVGRVLREYDENMDDDSYDEYDYYNEEAENDLRMRYPEFVNAALEDPDKVFYYWVAEGEDGDIYSSTCFETEDEAADDCDAKTQGMNATGYVNDLASENGKIYTDTVLYNEGDFWMD